MAATLAAERSGHREAIAFLRQGIDLARQLPDITRARELEVEMQLALGSSIATRSYSDPELAVAYDRARELCELLGNDVRVGQTLGGLSIFYINRGEIALGAELAERVLTIAEAEDDDLLEGAGRGPAQPGPELSRAGRPSRSSWPSGPSPPTAPSAIRSWATGSERTRAWPPMCSPGGDTSCWATSTGGSTQLVEAVGLAEQLGRPFNRVYRPGLSGHGALGARGDRRDPSLRRSRPVTWPRSRASPSGRDQRRVGVGRAGHQPRGPRSPWRR